MKNSIFTTSICLALSAHLFASPAEEILKKHAIATATDLEKYLQQNPDAPDKSQAHQGLLKAYTVTGNTLKKVAIFQEKFDALGSGADVTAMSLYGTTNSLFSLLLTADMKTEAAELVQKAIAKATENPKEAQLIAAFQKLDGRLNKPTVGDSLDMKFISVQGESINLADMKGKVVLIDFWATWCGPCIAELPHLKETYEEYHEKGFEIIGISLDKKEDKEKLLSFIEQRKMPWPQHFEEEAISNRFATKYGISSIPDTFLIGKDGKIIATKLRGDQLKKTVAEHIAK